jgi:hypothetical protein
LNFALAKAKPTPLSQKQLAIFLSKITPVKGPKSGLALTWRLLRMHPHP